MEIKHNLLILVILALLFACSDGNKKFKDFAFTKKIVFEEMHLDEEIGQVWSIDATNDYLVVRGRNLNATDIVLIDKKSRKSYPFGRKGQGPDELGNVANIIFDSGVIGIYDIAKSSIFNYNIDSIIRYGTKCNPEIVVKNVKSRPFLELKKINSQTYVTSGSLDINSLSRLLILNQNGDIITEGGTLPGKPTADISDIVHIIAYQGKITTNERTNRIAVVTHYAGIMQVYEYIDSTVNLINENVLFIADYKEQQGNFAPTVNTRWGYLSVDSDDKYIYALFSGVVQQPELPYYSGDEIHVFDWNGTPVGRLKIDRRLKNICVDDNGNIYGYYDSSQKADIVSSSVKEIIQSSL
jgi:hypothetical protein